MGSRNNVMKVKAIDPLQPPHKQQMTQSTSIKGENQSERYHQRIHVEWRRKYVSSK